MNRPRKPKPAPRKARDAEDSRRRLLDAAEKEFAGKGFAGARLGAIAKAARLKPGLIHFHFEDKQGLYSAVLARAFAALELQVRALLELGPTGGEPSREELHVFGEALVALTSRFYEENGHVLALLRHEARAGSSVVRRLATKHLEPVFEAVIQRIERLKAAGVVADDVDARHLFVAVVSMSAYPIVEPFFADTVFGNSAATRASVAAAHRSFVVETALARMLHRY
jgi:TetR/AcrR family transcriptional regulator